MVWRTWARSSGKTSSSNQGLSRSQRVVRQLGCGKTKYSGRKSRHRSLAQGANRADRPARAHLAPR